MRKILRILKRIWFLNFIRRIFFASTYFNKRYFQIFKWGISSREDTNFTYDLTDTNIKYLAHTISVATKKEYSEIMQYITEIQLDKELEETILNAIEGSSEKSFSDKKIRYGKRMGWYAFVRAMKPKVVIETGVDKGLGSIVLCAALLKNKEEGHIGKFYGTDINPKAGYILNGKYREMGEILYGDSIESLKQLDKKIDLFINDSDHSAIYEYEEYLTIEPSITDETVILGDNSHVTDKLVNFSNEKNRKFLFFKEVPLNHWYPGGGIGISYK